MGVGLSWALKVSEPYSFKIEARLLPAKIELVIKGFFLSWFQFWFFSKVCSMI
jgi:hypothetical protein